MKSGRRAWILGGLAAAAVPVGVVAVTALVGLANVDLAENKLPARSTALTAASALPDVNDSVITSEAQDGSHFVIDTPADRLSDQQRAARAHAVETTLTACGGHGEHPLVAASLVRATIDGYGPSADPNDTDSPVVPTVNDRLIWIVELANAQTPIGGPGRYFADADHAQQIQVSDIIVMVNPDQERPFRVETVSAGARMEQTE